MIRQRMHAMVLATLVTVVLTASCGGDSSDSNSADDTGQSSATTNPTDTSQTGDTSDTGETATTGEPVELTDSFRGVTADAIKVGVVIIDVSVIGRSNGDVEAQWRSAIDAVNAEGGVLGRSLEPVFAKYSPIGDVESEAACVSLTQDEEVFAAMGPLRSNLTCFTDVNETIFINTFGVSEEEFERSRAVAIGPGALPARNAGINVEALVDAGSLSGAVAIHASADAGDELGHWETALTESGVDVVSKTQSTVGTDDPAASEAEMEAFAQVWQNDDAETVLAIGAGSGLNVIAGVDRGAFRPTVVLTNPSDFDPNLYRDLGYSTDALADSVAVGFRDFQDLAATGEAGVGDCIDRFESTSGETVNLDPAEGEDVNLNTTIWACQAVDIFTQIATTAGGDLTNDSFRAAADSHGDLTVTAASPASIGEGKYDIGDGAPLLLTYDAGADDFVPIS